MLRSSLDLPHQTELDITARHVARLGSPRVPSYTAVDARLAWRPREGLEWSIAGQNLFGSGHGEFTDRTTRTQFGRAVFVELVSRF
jgi:iron complex outermembrane receptor protein